MPDDSFPVEVLPNFTSLADALAQKAATANGRGRQPDEGDAALAG